MNKYPPAYINGLMVKFDRSTKQIRLTTGVCAIKDVLYTLKKDIFYHIQDLTPRYNFYYLYLIMKDSLPEKPTFRFFITEPVKHGHGNSEMWSHPLSRVNRFIGLFNRNIIPYSDTRITLNQVSK